MTISAGWPINTVRVDNESNQWLQVLTGAATLVVAPYTLGAVFPVTGLGSVTVEPHAPATTTQASPISGETYQVTIYSESHPSSPGIALPASSAPSFATAWTQALPAGGSQLTNATKVNGLTPVTRAIILQAAPANAGIISVGFFLQVNASIGTGFQLAPKGLALAFSWTAPMDATMIFATPAIAGESIEAIGFF